MVLLIYLLSLVFLIFGWIYYYKPARIQKINIFFKEKIFNDRYVLLERKKISVVFFLAACLLFTSGFIKSQEEKKKKIIHAEHIDKEIIFDVISIYNKRLSEQPENIMTLIKLANAYEIIGEKNREFLTWKKVLAIDPENEAAKERIDAKY
ncbi:MAG: hypothetical protein FWH43_07320 [Endomicrobia bacterium]|nr:hypothetical protein [Endomicrobiia bacterium]